MSRNGFALLIVLLVIANIAGVMALLVQTVSWHTQGEAQRQAWHRARLLAMGGMAVIQSQRAQGEAVANLSLPSGSIAESDIDRYLSSLAAISVAGITMASDEKLLLGYDSATQQALVYCEIGAENPPISRLWLKVKI